MKRLAPGTPVTTICAACLHGYARPFRLTCFRCGGNLRGLVDPLRAAEFEALTVDQREELRTVRAKEAV